MTQWLRQSTAATVVLGPFVDATDGATAETALTISQADVRLSKNGAAFAQVNEATAAAHMENGNYSKALDATDTATLGRLRLHVNESGALPVFQDFMVVPAHVWDACFGATSWGEAVARGTLQSATATTAVLAAATSFADDRLVGMTLVITGGTGAGQARIITDYVNATDTATVDTWTTTPDNTSTYAVYPTAPASASAPPAVNVTQIAGAAVNTAAAQLGVNAVNIGGTAQTGADLASRLPAALVGGRMDASVGAVAANAITAAGVAADVGTEIAAAVQTSAAASPLPADVKKVNAVTVNGDGAGTPWGP